jgi:hypothetical protein
MTVVPSLFSFVEAELKMYETVMRRFGSIIAEYDGRHVELLIQRGFATYVREIPKLKDLLELVKFTLLCLAHRQANEARIAGRQIQDYEEELEKKKEELKQASEEDKKEIEARINWITNRLQELRQFEEKSWTFVNSVDAFLNSIKEVEL